MDNGTRLENMKDDLDPEVYGWISLTPEQRWVESQKLWATYLALGGSLDPEPDCQSPFFGLEEPTGKGKELLPDWINKAKANNKRLSLTREKPMIGIRIPKSQSEKAWRAMIELAPVRLVAIDPVYEVFPAHLELLSACGFTFELVRP